MVLQGTKDQLKQYGACDTYFHGNTYNAFPSNYMHNPHTSLGYARLHVSCSQNFFEYSSSIENVVLENYDPEIIKSLKITDLNDGGICNYVQTILGDSFEDSSREYEQERIKKSVKGFMAYFKF